MIKTVSLFILIKLLIFLLMTITFSLHVCYENEIKIKLIRSSTNKVFNFRFNIS